MMRVRDLGQDTERQKEQSAEKIESDEKLSNLTRRIEDLTIYKYYARTTGLLLLVILLTPNTT